MLRHIVYEPNTEYKIALLVKESALNKDEIFANYIKPLQDKGIHQRDIVVFGLAYNDSGKAPVSFIKSFLEELLPTLRDTSTETLYVADANYFKVMTKNTKADSFLGYELSCAIPDYTDLKVVLGINHRAIVYNPNFEPKLDMSIETLVGSINGQANIFTDEVIKDGSYPATVDQIYKALMGLHKHPVLTVDVETYSLDFWKAGLPTISFAWDKHSGIAFSTSTSGIQGNAGQQHIFLQLKIFFETYKGTLIFHNATFDIKTIIYNLFMKGLNDTAGLLEGLEVMTRNFHDTKVISYLALNTTRELNLSLKSLAHEFAGNYAQENITNIRNIPLHQLLEYNLVDTCCTHYVMEKYYPIMVQDEQLSIYHDVMLPSLKTITQMELTGMPLDPERVKTVKGELEAIRNTHASVIANSSYVHTAENRIKTKALITDYNDRKKKAKHPENIKKKLPEAFDYMEFNPGSSKNLQVLLYKVLGLPVLERTKTKQPATGADVLENLVNHTEDKEAIAVLEALVAYSKVDKILTTFIPAFEKAISKDDSGMVYLIGSFNLGGTISGRLSSSNPNLQNLPSGSTYGKLIKSCFVAPTGWLFTGADSDSLEDRISALTTKDPNKLKVYTDGYDGHCVRAFSYFPDRLPDIVDTVESINSIKEKYPEVRQDSKAPTFALTYGGMFKTLMKNCGFPEPLAKSIEANYHELYKVSDEWVAAKLAEAERTGYVTGAFGLRLRTPVMAKTIRGNRATPFEAEAEGRSAGNMLGQSYCLLNSRAANAFMQRVWASKYKLDILPIAQIHDACYFLIRDNLEVIEWVNRELVECMSWQELPEIQHDEVKLGAELDIHYESWAQPITIPNNATPKVIKQVAIKGKNKYLKEK